MKPVPDRRRIEVVDDAMVAVLRSKTVCERVAMIFSAHRLMRLRIEGHLRSIHTDWNDDQIAAEVSRRLLHGAG